MSAELPEGLSAGDIYDEITKRLSQCRGIVDCLGNLNQESGSLDDFSENDASWAVKDLLCQARTYVDALLALAKQREGGAA